MDAPRRSLADWLEYQQRVHVRGIDMGLARVGEVWRRLGAPAPAPRVVTVGGTNGKGSTIAFLEAMLAARGLRVGAYTSPHLLQYNERVRVEGHDASDAELVEAFERIEAARGEIPLTYFEFGTLAAFLVFARCGVEVALLEVGLGGRLDAVNLVDADVAVITTIDLDHQDWLGDDRDAIGREKAGILREGRPAILGEASPPAGLLDAAAAIGARVVRAGIDFAVETDVQGGAVWRQDDIRLEMPALPLAAPCQLANAAAAVASVVALLGEPDAEAARSITRGLASARITARLQRVPGPPELVIDVAHNPQAARTLAAWLAANPPRGRNLAAFGVLADKDIDGILAPLLAYIDRWHLGGLDAHSPRGTNAAELAAHAGLEGAVRHASIEDALHGAFADAAPGDRVLAFGSFFVAAAALAHVDRDAR